MFGTVGKGQKGVMGSPKPIGSHQKATIPQEMRSETASKPLQRAVW
jgi:hypothetical protein